MKNIKKIEKLIKKFEDLEKRGLIKKEEYNIYSPLNKPFINNIYKDNKK